MSQNHITSLDRITALQLLPMAATIVAAGAGARITEILPNQSHALGTIIVSYVLWGLGTPFAMLLLVIYYQRLAVHKLPSRETIVSCCLPLGPLGFGGFGLVGLPDECLGLTTIGLSTWEKLPEICWGKPMHWTQWPGGLRTCWAFLPHCSCGALA